MIKEENVKQRMVRFRKKHKKQEDSVVSSRFTIFNTV